MRKPAKAASLFAFAAMLAACSGRNAEDQEVAQATEPAAAATDVTAGEAAAGDPAAPAAAPTPEQAKPASSAAAATAPQAAATPPAAFFQCRSCHATEPGKNLIGPSLAGIFGTKAGEVAGYSFSTAMKDSGLTWDEATLDSFLKSPREVIPGTKMAYPGLKDDTKRAEVVAYIKALK
ncbi:c-type cytochrome [Tsuneonella sp. CC-YZS046]|uniref:c-type cytochrome n=1 Tax=Tsuneonella sp. CC-YZS046 TaxID=3042152 RepID=UPI002D779DDC|nr:c-type cytochrome [Tsuneonella sp. CC-YZS046]WRO65760.1 c-type cytochrome [Tsuneonella sp. CC-YZS046]